MSVAGPTSRGRPSRSVTDSPGCRFGRPLLITGDPGCRWRSPAETKSGSTLRLPPMPVTAPDPPCVMLTSRGQVEVGVVDLDVGRPVGRGDADRMPDEPHDR